MIYVYKAVIVATPQLPTNIGGLNLQEVSETSSAVEGNTP